MKESGQLSASLEDYLEAIYLIVQQKQAARAKDIVTHLKVRAASVTGALKQLSEKVLVNHAPYDIITLTRSGERLARDVFKRHQALYDFFVTVLGIDPQEAEESACKLEHVISAPILSRLIRFVAFVQDCPRVGAQWIQEFDSFCKRGSKTDTSCEACLIDCLRELRRSRTDPESG